MRRQAVHQFLRRGMDPEVDVVGQLLSQIEAKGVNITAVGEKPWLNNL